MSFLLFASATLALTPLSHGGDFFERLGFGKSKATNPPAAAGIGSVLTQEIL